MQTVPPGFVFIYAAGLSEEAFLDNKILDHLYDLFYRCRFAKLLSEIGKLETDVEGARDCAAIALIKASALFEMHKVNDAKTILRNMTRDGQSDDAYLYALGRLCYMEEQFDQARMVFEEVIRRSDNPRYLFKAKLGIANCVWDAASTKDSSNYKKIPAVIEELCSFEPLDRDEDHVSLLIFLGNYYSWSGASTELARRYFRKALSRAAVRSWNYFISRALHGLAHVAKAENNTSELLWTLDILQAFVDESEALAFSWLVNRDFQSYFSINTQLEFDKSNKRILLRDRWLAFHDKPMLYRFLELLHMSEQFVGKDTIAADLWPEEDYKPRVHDPRIFDIAKRARAMIEACDTRPVVLLSGRLGYKLASN